MGIQNAKVFIDLRRGKFQYIPNEKINLKYLGCLGLSHNDFFRGIVKVKFLQGLKIFNLKECFELKYFPFVGLA